MSPNTIFETQIMPTTDKMYRYAYSILKESTLAQDVVQDCLVKIWSKRHKLVEIQSPEAWAMRITRNQCYDWVKTNRFTVLSDQDIDRPSSEHTDFNMMMAEQANWLALIMERLPEKQQEIYHLREIEELTYQDIAEILSISLSEVKVYLHRARTTIKTSLAKIDAYGIAN
jgi:RNA polymerase sigma factor (sigma-70 family)